MINISKKNFSRHGIPQVLYSDNATNFVNKVFRDFVKQWGIKHVSSSPHYPRSNGKAEATVKIAKKLIRKVEDNDEDLWLSLVHLRNVPNKIGSSPVQRIFSRQTRTLTPSAITNYQPEIITNVSEIIEKNKQNTKFYYDKASKHLPNLQFGQPVYAQINPESNKTWTPGYIEKQLTDRSYLVNVNGNQYRRNITQVKPTVIPAIQQQTSEPANQPKPSPEKKKAEPQTSQEITECSVEESESVKKRMSETCKPKMTETSRPTRERKLPNKYKDFICERHVIFSYVMLCF